MRQSGHIKMLLPLCLLAMMLCCRAAMADPISLQAHQIAGRTVQLEWDAGTGTTDIYRRYPDENQLSLIGSTSSNTWTDRHNRSVCNDTVYYVVRRGGDEGSAAINISDNEPTAPAQWGVVTVDQALQHIKLEWIASQDTDIMGYLVLEGTPSFVIDTVYGRTNTSYTYTQDSCMQVREFRIYAFDSCRKASALTEQCNNMVLHLESEPCSRTLTARWNTYNNMPSGLGRYELWVSQDDAAFVLAGQQNNISDTSIDFTITEECQQVKAYVKAVSADGTLEALSNIKQEVLATSQRPSILYLRKVSVSDDGKNVTVVGQTDTSWAGHQYTVYRSVGGGAANVAGFCTASATGGLVWTDRGVNLDEKHTYFFGITDGCGRNEMRSQKGSTILVELVTEGNSTNLQWNAYEGWQGTTTYGVLTCRGESNLWQLEGTTTNNWMPNVSDGAGGLCRYKVAAFEGPDSQYGHSDSLQSTVAVYNPHTDIWMPNAITPLENSNNAVCPVSVYITPDQYSFSIYNRMGLCIFSSTTPGQSWDGTYNGHHVPEGAYTYIINYLQSDGSRQQKTGTILIIY